MEEAILFKLYIYIYIFFFSKKTLIFLLKTFFFSAIQPLLRSGPRSLGAGVLGHGLGALGYSVCGHHPRQPQTHSCLDLSDVRMVQPKYGASCSSTSFTNGLMMPVWRRCRWQGTLASAPCKCTLSRLLYAGCAFWTSCPQDPSPAGSQPAAAVQARHSPFCSSFLKKFWKEEGNWKKVGLFSLQSVHFCFIFCYQTLPISFFHAFSLNAIF